ncbi:hypothetical protein [Undibacterium sp.]|jgi:hypothetical protein|uniref:hypothetical protein n=1 Tax=Undibacterium sp. TaxID=1914977 RepID=UPI002B7C8B4C|nr:hypothetical protein [Undibacterium sp.]HTD04895.1 hypothetical protein [Undibacterium sp.]
MIISKQRIINEYQHMFSHHASSHDHALQRVAQVLGVAEQVIADTVNEAGYKGDAQFA